MNFTDIVGNVTHVHYTILKKYFFVGIATPSQVQLSHLGYIGVPIIVLILVIYFCWTLNYIARRDVFAAQIEPHLLPHSQVVSRDEVDPPAYSDIV